jgi:hypothetical protein
MFVSDPDARSLLPAIAGANSPGQTKVDLSQPPAGNVPTLLLDDTERFKHDLRVLLISGHSQSGATLLARPRYKEPARPLSAACPKALARIGDLPESIASRAIEIRMEPKPSDRELARLRPGQRNPGLAQRMAAWARSHAHDIGAAVPQCPPGVGNRLLDNWEPLLAIADLLGGDWPVLARNALLQIRNAKDDMSTYDIQTLGVVRYYFQQAGHKVAFTREIVDWLNLKTAEQGIMPTLTAEKLADLLRPFGVPTNTNVRRDGKLAKGYRLESLQNAFERYLFYDRTVANGSTPAPAESMAAIESNGLSQKSRIDLTAIVNTLALNPASSNQPLPSTEERYPVTTPFDETSRESGAPRPETSTDSTSTRVDAFQEIPDGGKHSAIKGGDRYPVTPRARRIAQEKIVTRHTNPLLAVSMLVGA